MHALRHTKRHTQKDTHTHTHSNPHGPTVFVLFGSQPGEQICWKSKQCSLTQTGFGCFWELQLIYCYPEAANCSADVPYVCREYLEVHQAEMELLSSQQRETKRNSRLVRREGEELTLPPISTGSKMTVIENYVFFCFRLFSMTWKR